MEITLERRYKKAAYTIGKLSINGTPTCDTIEDTDRGLRQDMTLTEIMKRKVKGETAIPTGRYRVNITYSPRFRRDLPILIDVKGFDGIRIHSGNTARDTEGCILPGVNKKVGMVLDSRHWFEIIYDKIRKALNRKENVWITIK